MGPRTLFSAIVLAGLMIQGHPATAKLPPWTCEPSTTRPIVGEVVRIEVRFWDRRFGKWVPARWPTFRSIPLFLEARSDSSGGSGRSVLNRSIDRVRPGIYEAAIIFPDTSRYRLTQCSHTPHYETDPGFDPARDLVIQPIRRPERGATRPWRGLGEEPSSSSAVPMVGGLATAILLAFVVRDRSRRRALTDVG
jgi:hypothetical protein